jgi:uncharacterized protein with PIN domain
MTTGQYLFFDTSALVKYFREEPGSARVITLIEEDRHAVRISALARVEFVSAIHRKRREGLLSQAQLQTGLIRIRGGPPGISYRSVGALRG